MKEIMIKVEGMMCLGCENRIKNTLSLEDGVAQVEANHEKGIVKIILEKDISKDILEERITDLGFEIL